MNKTIKKLFKIIAGIIIGLLALSGILFWALFVYFYPVIDRLYIRPCYYYPHAFADCVENNQGGK